MGSKSCSLCFQFALGYDDSSKTYKVVEFHVEENKPALAKSEVKVFILGGNCWRNIQSFPVIPLNWLDYGNTSINSGVHLSGTINWLAIHKYFHQYYIYEYISHVEQFVIISLDLSTETYKQLLLPQGFDEVPFVQPVLKISNPNSIKMVDESEVGNGGTKEDEKHLIP
ncbi:F-box protein interaction domain protein [Medicago truncatula]|uniref:F-box protein interaction domain protein n=1 Tax=Medicago truncatula TaxID=3880 RepID=A0A072U0M8_MEDTR|nr:F-box protein interaction domain protein [Medicago truncatula]